MAQAALLCCCPHQALTTASSCHHVCGICLKPMLVLLAGLPSILPGLLSASLNIVLPLPHFCRFSILQTARYTVGTYLLWRLAGPACPEHTHIECQLMSGWSFLMGSFWGQGDNPHPLTNSCLWALEQFLAWFRCSLCG